MFAGTQPASDPNEREFVDPRAQIIAKEENARKAIPTAVEAG